jgi:hypothetical protein
MWRDTAVRGFTTAQNSLRITVEGLCVRAMTAEQRPGKIQDPAIEGKDGSPLNDDWAISLAGCGSARVPSAFNRSKSGQYDNATGVIFGATAELRSCRLFSFQIAVASRFRGIHFETLMPLSSPQCAEHPIASTHAKLARRACVRSPTDPGRLKLIFHPRGATRSGLHMSDEAIPN